LVVSYIQLQNHGVVTIGETLQEAFNRFITLEYLAQSIVNATQIGIPIPLKENVLQIRRDQTRNEINFLLPVKRCPFEKCCCARRTLSGTEKELRTDLCKLTKRAYDQNLFTASSGAMSIRQEMETRSSSSDAGSSDEPAVAFLITPTCTFVDRADLSPKDICYLSNSSDCTSYDCMFCNGSKVQFHTNTSTETSTSTNTNSETSTIPSACHHHQNPISFGNIDIEPSHTSEIHHTIYKTHPEVNCIIVAQPKYATSFCITGKHVNVAGIPESHLIVGDVQTLPFESLQEGGLAIAQILNPTEGITTVFVTGFGLISAGVNPLKTFVQVEVCESICGVLLAALRRGPPVLLDRDQVREIDVLFRGGH